ncbi:hypothetical protein MIMGU_mgv1a013061mg [Erythranthe guttata]|uniref:Uncharacterized protein n=1 Tax=Erythranthe guttata TaxID=4155 RepID=A0A022Q083_ERYGU|nr:PREDICTED: centrosomal protein of 290 kDa-like [Erythranthe guttata]XP_012858507.1 PREDICTED: centrosomal protein of 290 kDa-like [Erythranthe guttata]EYU19920.1 hypothetical protein MIMGU_mgv1a013061mg [Erythranthe guttata]|eukprot:XP_012858506.1 PREDICTED: centrosomal protein of 290 kDa-like [Erythranthe guttata]
MEMEMDCYDCGMKLSKLNAGESDTKKRMDKIVRQVTKLQEKKPSTNKHTAKINMILDLVNLLKEKEEESEEDDKLESMKKLEEEKKLELMKKSEEEVKELESMKELELEEEKKVEANEMPKWMEMKLTEMLSHSSRPMYDRDSTIHTYTPQVVEKLKGYAKLAIDVFNQQQPIKYTVVDVVKSIRRLISGSVLDLTFTAKPDDAEDAIVFYANIRRRVGRPVKVTYVGIEK